MSSIKRIPPPPDYPKLKVPSVFDVPAYLEKEDARFYIELWNLFNSALKPRDGIEKIWVQDLTCLQLRILKMRRIQSDLPKSSFIASEIGMLLQAAKLIINKKDKEDLAGVEMLADEWLEGRISKEKLYSILSSAADSEWDTAKARAFSNDISSISKIEQMIGDTMKARDRIFREFERHRESFGKKLHHAPDDIETADYEVIRSDRREAANENENDKR